MTCARCVSSSLPGKRPSKGCTPSVVNSDDVPPTMNSRSTRSSVRAVACIDWNIPMSSIRSASSRYETKNSGPTANSPGRSEPGAEPRIVTRRSASRNDKGLIRTASTTLKIAVFAPIASVRVATVTSVNPGARRRRRTAWMKSLVQLSSVPLMSPLLFCAVGMMVCWAATRSRSRSTRNPPENDSASRQYHRRARAAPCWRHRRR